MGRQDSDEAYVLDLCDEVLAERGERQRRFDWLVGDPSPSGRRARLPVDSCWPGHGLVVEYREIQHDRPVTFFDKPEALYDARREALIPANGLELLVIRPADLAADSRGRLLRVREADLAVLRRLLATAEHRLTTDEDRVVAVFRRWLISRGWTAVLPTDHHTDIEAVRDGRRIVGEAKGRTKEPGVDADIAYGQLLRRMTDTSETTRYALVVPTSGLRAARRVPVAVRHVLRIDVYEVTDTDGVRPAAD
ncbi:hypothetical protein [Actinacidiphila glaucinigra]|uniref:Restriction endonuclease n=1 Tax=Actinacidiphila glaucinigra TaxID=235986 RepID=A0A239H532_9ACTN|nr:hypothetical protein [Actinacidiphila glaucinigra]SNS76255.1 hypothetical protein SAMN05216252_108191 [Actinacidiphila glaucinigra]